MKRPFQKTRLFLKFRGTFTLQKAAAMLTSMQLKKYMPKFKFHSSKIEFSPAKKDKAAKYQKPRRLPGPWPAVLTAAG
ncbi:MAG: hypothetical protein ACE3JR_03725 [Ectobacillus sp.]